MSVLINAEHFELNPEQREAISNKLSKLGRVLDSEVNVRLFLRALPKSSYSATLSVHAERRDFACTATGNDILHLVTAVEADLHRELVEHNHRRIHARRKRTAV